VGARNRTCLRQFPFFFFEKTYVSASVQLPPCVEMIEVEQGVEDEEIAADGFPPLNRIVGKKNHVSLPQRRIDYHRALGDVAAIEETRREQIALIAEPEHHPGP
jgi:hypothetical protein